tara:strand:- start:32 stop:601 length:570 start_codon:yes stop_codon:yes gene_type:complete
MITALVGAHGTGKTTVFKVIKERHPDWLYFTEGVRHQVPAFGYESPYEIVDEIGIGAFELMNVNSWSVIDPGVNTLLRGDESIITDRSVVDNFAYYLTLRQEPFEGEQLLRNMATHYASLVDTFVYFPIGIFPLIGDSMRPQDEEYQRRHDANIKIAFQELGVPQEKIHMLEAISVEARVKEILVRLLK